MNIEEQFDNKIKNNRSVCVVKGFVFLGFAYSTRCYYKMVGVDPYGRGEGLFGSFNLLHLIRRGK